MKRNFKRSLSLILSVLMIIAVIPFSGMASSACTHPNKIITVVKNELKHIVICPDCGLNEKSDCASSSTGEATCETPKLCDVCKRELSSTHKFELEVEAPQTLVKEVNCDEFNVYYKTCACGKISETETFTSEVKGTIHDFTAKSNEYIAKKVCGENLFYYFACSRCGVSAEGFDVDPNTYADEDVTVEHKFYVPDEPVQGTLKSNPTCTSSAVFYMICENCPASAKGIDETKTYTYGDALEHEFVDFTKVVDITEEVKAEYLIIPATCSVQAMYSKLCKHCGAPAVEGLWDSGFDPNNKEYHITVDVVEDGVVVSVGNAFYYGEPLNHGKLKVTKEAKAQTCTTDGNTEELSCDYCGTIMDPSEKLPKLGHKLDSKLIQEYKAPTCVQNGQLGKVKCVREGCGVILEVNGKGETETKENIKTFDMTKRGHLDENNDLICDREDCLSTLDPSDVCTCICHGTGFMYFIGWILKWIWSLMGTNPYCKCGEAHYAVD